MSPSRSRDPRRAQAPNPRAGSRGQSVAPGLAVSRTPKPHVSPVWFQTPWLRAALGPERKPESVPGVGPQGVNTGETSKLISRIQPSSTLQHTESHYVPRGHSSKQRPRWGQPSKIRKAGTRCVHWAGCSYRCCPGTGGSRGLGSRQTSTLPSASPALGLTEGSVAGPRPFAEDTVWRGLRQASRLPSVAVCGSVSCGLPHPAISGACSERPSLGPSGTVL